MKFTIVYLLAFCFLMISCGEKPSPLESEKPIQENDDAIQEGDMSCIFDTIGINIVNTYPFSEADRIELVNFDAMLNTKKCGAETEVPEKAQMNLEYDIWKTKIVDDTVKTPHVLFRRDLTSDEKKRIFELLNFYKIKEDPEYLESMMCYDPHHALVFYKNNIPFDFLEICFDCRNFKSHTHFKVEFCTEKWCLLAIYFMEIGLYPNLEFAPGGINCK